MSFRVPAGASALILLCALCGCGQEDPEWAAYSDATRGYSLAMPDEWHLATERMSRISEPRELFSVGTLALQWRPTDCEAFAGAAGAGMGRADVVVTVWERGHDRHSTWSDFPPRPAAFGPVHDGDPASDCGEPAGTKTHWRNFSEAGRHFHTFVRIGPDASPGPVAEAWGMLDRLSLDPDYRPDWRASG